MLLKSRRTGGLLTGFTLAMFSLSALAEVAPRWLPIGPGGGTVLRLVADPQRPGVLFAGTEGAGVYRTGNRGNDWSNLSRGIANPDIRSMLVDPNQADTLYVGTFGGGIFKSLDGGCSWLEINDGLTDLSIFALGTGTDGDGTIFAGSLNSGLFQSSDGGETWAAANNGIPADASITSIVADSSTSSLYLSTTAAGVFRSQDQGQSWQAINNGIILGIFDLALGQPNSQVIYAGAFSGVFRSDDGGDSWTFLLQGPRTLVTRLAIDPRNDDTIFAGTLDTGVSRSLDGGETWTTVNDGLTDLFVETLLIDPHDPGTIYVTTEAGGAYRSADQGDTWESLNDQLYAFATNSVAVNQDDPEILFQSPARGPLTHSSDGGRTWQTVLEEDAFTVHQVVLDSDNPDRIFAAGGRQGVYRSLDGGQSWTTLTLGLSDIIRSVAVHPLNSDTVYAAGDDGVFRSLDGGANWQDSDQGLSVSQVNFLIIDPTDAQTLYAATQQDVFHSHDGGDSWQRSDEELTGAFTSLAGAAGENPVVYAGGPETGVFRSLDRGHSWESIADGLGSQRVSSLLAPSDDPDRILAGTEDQGVFESLDLGETWTPLGRGLGRLQVRSLASSPRGTIYAGTLGSVWRFDPDVEFLHFAQYGQGSIGPDRISSELLLIDLDPAEDAQALLSFRGDEGAPLKVRLNDIDIVGDRLEHVPAGGLLSSLSSPDAALAAGSLQVQSASRLAGVLLFAGNVGVAGVGNSLAFREGFGLPLDLDSALGIDTGIAIVNLEPQEVDFNTRLYDSDRSLLARAQFRLAGDGHAALFASQFDWQPEPGVMLDLDDFEGLLEVDGGRAAATVLQTRPGELATLPVFDLAGQNPAGGGDPLPPQTLHFAQFGAGVQGQDRLDSRLLFLNLNLSEEADVTIRFRDDQGQPATVTVNGAAAPGELQITVPPGALRTLDTSEQQQLVSGSVSVDSTQPLAGVILFTGSVGVAGVASSPPFQQSLVTPVISLEEGSVNTGIAVQELSGAEALLEIRLFTADRTSVASAQLTLPAHGHRALFVNQFDWVVEAGQVLDFSDLRGLLEVRFTGEITATAIQTRPGQFATLPVAQP